MMMMAPEPQSPKGDKGPAMVAAVPQQAKFVLRSEWMYKLGYKVSSLVPNPRSATARSMNYFNLIMSNPFMGLARALQRACVIILESLERRAGLGAAATDRKRA